MLAPSCRGKLPGKYIQEMELTVSAAPTTAEAWLEATKTEDNEALGALAPLAPDRLLNEVSHQ